jgi:hypothetical protein
MHDVLPGSSWKVGVGFNGLLLLAMILASQGTYWCVCTEWMDGVVADYARTHYSLDLVAFPAHVRARSNHIRLFAKKQRHTYAFPKRQNKFLRLIIASMWKRIASLWTDFLLWQNSKTRRYRKGKEVHKTRCSSSERQCSTEQSVVATSRPSPKGQNHSSFLPIPGCVVGGRVILDFH